MNKIEPHSQASMHHRNVIYGWQTQDNVPLAHVAKAKGVWLSDVAGNRMLDFCSGQINVNIGHSHPAVLKALREQSDALCYIAPSLGTTVRDDLAAQIADLMPGDDLQHVFFNNSGSEAIENAMKVARAVTGRQKIYASWTSYHGATFGASALSGDQRRTFVEPSMAGIRHFHSPLGANCIFDAKDHRESSRLCFAALQEQILRDGPQTVAAIFIEPIIGTSGLYVMPTEFLRDIRQLCDHHGILLVFDETMSGWGRTGAWFGCEHSGVLPDILTTAKGLTSGYIPLGAMVVTREIYQSFLKKPFVGGLTTEGHSLACAVGLANLAVYRSEELITKSASLGAILLKTLKHLQHKHSCVRDVRGKGLFCCLELTSFTDVMRANGKRYGAPTNAADIVTWLWQQGMFVIMRGTMIFLAPPLVISQDELNHGISILAKLLDQIDSFGVQDLEDSDEQ